MALLYPMLLTLNSRMSSQPPEPVPPYDATHGDVFMFLAAYFGEMLGLGNNDRLEYAQRLLVDGQGLYQANEKMLVDIYGANGHVLFHDLHNSQYGRVCLSPLHW